MRAKNLFFVLFSSCLFSQNTFNYQRDWGTYFGATNTGLSGIYEDNSSNIFADAITSLPSPNIGNPPTSYYNQFITLGGQTFTGNIQDTNNFSGKLSSSGNLLQAEYTPNITSSSSRKAPYFRDDTGNMYEFESNLMSYPTLPSGVWLSSHNEPDDIILSKYDSNNNLLWKTYLPGNASFNSLEIDTSGNIYIAGLTKWQNLGDFGTFQPNFSMVYDSAGILLPNTYIVKLNPQGQKIWATYTPSKLIGGMTIYGNNLYIFGQDDLKPAGVELSTPNTFQIAKSGQFISNIDGTTGKQIWGTYYGTIGNFDSGISDIKADETGVYIVGMTFGVPSNYYATEGAYKANTTDGFDMFVTKFNTQGNRIWSTYIGSDNYDSFSGERGLDVKNGKVLFTGLSMGNQNISTPGAYINIKPNPTTEDVFFGMLDTNTGSPDFISYYGGFLGNSTEPVSIYCSFSKYSDGFYLYGDTPGNNGFSSANGYQPNIIYPAGITVGISSFIAKFSPKYLSTSEINSLEDLVLYNNPNNGNFSLKGSVLNKEPHIININDMSGRLIYSRNIQKNEEEHFNLEDKLINGTYQLSINKVDQTLIKSFKLMIKK